MEVFNIKNNKVEVVELNPFKLEKDIQDVIEKNILNLIICMMLQVF